MFKEMNYVYAVYKEKSFTKAATKHFVSQPALSAMIKKAEQKIGMPIFDRTTTPISLTPAGEYYIAQAERIMEIERISEIYFRSLKEGENNTLRLGGSSFFITYMLTPAVKEFQKTHEILDVRWAEMKNRVLLAALEENDIDLFVEVDDFDIPGIGKIKLGEENIILAVPENYPVNDMLKDYRMTAEDIHNKKHMKENAPKVNLAWFRECPFILLREGNDSYDRAIRMCANAGFTPQNISIQADQVMTSYYLSVEGHGISFIRDSILFHENISRGLYYYSPDDALSRRNVYIYYSKDKVLTKAAREFIDFIKHYTIPDLAQMCFEDNFSALTGEQ